MAIVLFNGVEYRRFDHLYAVARDGSLLRQMEPYIPRDHPQGYLSAGRHRLVHRMVATCWLERPAHANHVHHKDHDKTNNHADNLEWVTPLSHMRDHHADTSRGHNMTEAGKAKLRALRLGSKMSEETKAKQRAASLRLGLKPPALAKGSKRSAETCAKMRQNSTRRNECRVLGTDYVSYREASEATGIKVGTIRKRCLSENFPDYELKKG